MLNPEQAKTEWFSKSPELRTELTIQNGTKWSEELERSGECFWNNWALGMGIQNPKHDCFICTYPSSVCK